MLSGVRYYFYLCARNHSYDEQIRSADQRFAGTRNDVYVRMVIIVYY